MCILSRERERERERERIFYSHNCGIRKFPNQGSNRHTWILVGFVTTEPQQELPTFQYLMRKYIFDALGNPANTLI